MGRGTVRRTYSLYLLLVFFGAAFACQYASGGIIYNGGFESDFSVIPNWSVSLADNGTLQRVTSWQSLADSTKTVSPKEGMYFLLIKSDESPPTDTILWQHVTLSVGDVISGWIAIDANLSVYQYADSDYAQVRILQNTNELFSMVLTVDQLKNNSSLLNWQFWSWTAPATGTYIIELRAMDDTSKIGLMTWWGLFDGITVTSSVIPEPSVGVAAMSGLVTAIGLAALRRAKSRMTTTQ